MNKARPPLEVLDWGRLDYAEAFRRQWMLVEERIADGAPDRLIFVEHPPVVTLGRSGGAGDLRVSRETLREAGIAFYNVDRGGRATYHGPGQMVVYSIAKLVARDIHSHIDLMLKTTANLLRSFGLESETKAGHPGVWVNGAKIASIGMAVQKEVIYHGLSLNVNTDLDGFQYIVTCGQPDERVTSLKQVLGRRIDMGKIKNPFAGEFIRTFDYCSVKAMEEAVSRCPVWPVHPLCDPAVMERMDRVVQ